MSRSYFNTSHVTVYRLTHHPLQIYFNTSHVTVYRRDSLNQKSSIIISIHLMLLFIGSVEPQFVIDRYFNTSHVTVYQPQCYQHQSLYLISIHLMLLFILSSDRIHLCLPSISIHLMLLFIFMSILLSIKKEYFNTSHVTVYQSYTNGFPSSLLISIHLMLLFILLLTGLRIDC